ETKMGPMARMDLRDTVHEQVSQSVEAGAELILGGKIPEQKGAWYPATILTDIPDNCPAAQEELFGPVACIFRVRNEAEAIKLANDTKYGLGAAIFTKNIENGERIAREELNAGSCFVNEMVKSDPKVPFGGIGMSGYGREMGKEGMLEFTNMKTVFVR
ncbi:MAG: aldehyde dehydrogenase family protein, partial [Saprospiraceae bacterium]